MSMLIKFLSWLTFPLFLSMCAAVVGLVILKLGWSRLGKVMLAFAFAWSWVWSLPACSQWLRGLLENHYPIVPEASLPKADAIVVLGGATVFYWADNPDIKAEDLKHSRVATGARAWLAGRAPVIILTGGRGEAAGMAEVLPKLDVPRSALILEERAVDTGQNAFYTAAIARKHRFRRLLLVTSAIHMPRAMLLFRRAGLEDVVPVPVQEWEHWAVGGRRWLPSLSALWRSGRAFKEIGGLAEAYVKYR